MTCLTETAETGSAHRPTRPRISPGQSSRAKRRGTIRKVSADFLDRCTASVRDALIRAARGAPAVGSMAVVTIVSCGSSSDCAAYAPSDGSTCGNGLLEAGEDCEPALAVTTTCAVATGNPSSTGTVQCNYASCRFNVVSCSGTGGVAPAFGAQPHGRRELYWTLDSQ